MTPTLAIIIPAYKAGFLAKALQSLFDQTNKNFTVYIGDDHPGGGLYPICEPFLGRLPQVVYHPFPSNLGDADLVGQWERCIRLSQEEPWIWLFSDDDFLSPNCVESFYRALENTQACFDLYRFNKVEVDATGKLATPTPLHPLQESSLQFCYHLLKDRRRCTAVEYIFSRRAFDQYGGFVSFPKGWGSDWCTWLQFGKEKGIRLIPAGRVYYRYNPGAISSGAQFAEEKIRATLAYLKWMIDFFEGERTSDPLINGQAIRPAGEQHLFASLSNFT